ncbi:MAG: class I SAM-dependent methyltransferase [Ignavibacteriales bacterium]|nr:class I SAM-dependent methyltransferase [Ignavibacteriales bacterium]
MANTANIRSRLEEFLRVNSIHTLLDIACGDFHWMKEVDLGTTKYIGGEIVADLVERNNRLYASPDRTFVHLDIINSMLPAADAILCRDCLPHLPTQHILLALQNIKRSKAKYLVTSNYPLCRENVDIPIGKFRRINLELEPFFLSAPLQDWEDFDGQYADKHLALWKLAGLLIPAR